MARIKIPEVATIDFETHPVGQRPDYPPKPVGVSIMLPGEKKSKYWAFGHPTGNNCSEADARRALEKAYKSGVPLLCHHAKFDLDVAETHWGLRLPAWHGFHESMFLLFYRDPHGDLQLKPAAEQHLGMKPEERDAILQWAIDSKLLPRTAKKVGHLICKAPGDLVGRYADGDVIRTFRLFQKLYPYVAEHGMLEAYDRDRRLMPILLANEREGMQANVALMKKDKATYTKAAEDADAWLRKTLKSPDLNIDSPDQMGEALINSGKVDEDLLLRTPKGAYSMSKDSLLGAVTDKRLLQVMQYRSKLDTAKGTFLLPWHDQAVATGGRIHPSWNQVRMAGNFGDAGARTGRMSASRFMNVPKPFEEEEGKFEMPRFKGLALPELPLVRLYCLPDKGEMWGKRDYSQQELRVLAHFEDGMLMSEYLENPTMDVHQFAADMIVRQYNLPVKRKHTKTIGFGLLYGMGLGALAERMGVDMETARKIKTAYMNIFPGLKDIQDELKARAQAGLPLRTWGGREYYVEEPRFMKERNRVVTFEYKLLNYLIQGSSADCTKEAIIRYDSVRKDGKFRVTVHDEVNISAPMKAMKSEMKLLREAMASVEFDVPMLSDGKVGRSWGQLQEFKEAA
jgi:DNA polymerase I-like protein with 3'-5' exonuclease and polymerase domains